MTDAVILLTCPGCNTRVEVPSARVHAEAHPELIGGDRLIYTCPSCRRPQLHNLDPGQWEIIRRMTADLGGIRTITMPAGIAGRFANGQPALDEDDLIAFGLELRQWATT